jgi:hypothetical protein
VNHVSARRATAFFNGLLGDAAGKRLTWGFRNIQLWMSHTTGTASYDAYTAYGGDVGSIAAPTLFRIRRTGATIYFEIALDGLNFDVITTEAATAYLGSNVTTYGIGILPTGSFQRIVCYGLLALLWQVEGTDRNRH